MSVFLNPSLITILLTEMEGCPFPTLVGIWYNPLRVNRAPICYDEVNIPECNYNFGACCFRQIIRLLELLAVVFCSGFSIIKPLQFDRYFSIITFR